jgi:nucleoid DNA-binding protein
MAADEKSLAVRLTLASPDATLTDDQIEAAVRAVVDASPAARRSPEGLRMGTCSQHEQAAEDIMEFAVESLETPALTKAQLAELLFEQIGLNKRESKDMIDAFFDLISGSLVDGQDVKISGFGNFQIRTKAPRPGPQPAHRRSHPDRGAARGHLPRQPQAQGTDPGQRRRGFDARSAERHPCRAATASGAQLSIAQRQKQARALRFAGAS